MTLLAGVVKEAEPVEDGWLVLGSWIRNPPAGHLLEQCRYTKLAEPPKSLTLWDVFPTEAPGTVLLKPRHMYTKGVPEIKPGDLLLYFVGGVRPG